MRQRFAPSGVIHNCSPPPSESFTIFAPGSARFIARSVRGMLVSPRGVDAAYQRIYQQICWTQTDATRPPEIVFLAKPLFSGGHRTNLDVSTRPSGAQER